MKCIVDGCNNESVNRSKSGVCHTHYMREYYHRPENHERIKSANKKYREQNREFVRQSGYETARTVKGKWSRFKAESRRDENSIDISFEDFEKLQSQKCHYCGSNLPETGRGLDRKDSSLGYTLENVVPCCWPCNDTKGDKLSYEEMLNLVAFRHETLAASQMVGAC